MTKPLLELLTGLCKKLNLPSATGTFNNAPAPETFVVFTPIADVFDLYAANQPGVDIEHVRLSLFTRGNYLHLRDLLCHGILQAGITVEARTYVGFEADTGYHHYAIDCVTYRAV
ncbi:hypothetical protein [Corynebacterium sp. 142RC1]|uniref:hypothetical protein n=1 Tax=unclassified Corynebacterium TaxID=2624378 RepID=UPI00211B870C|nr:hypothetical protein [Corynebacterium sp. 142RC1]MCQ9365376.1 hypothetical protein [Corynebacterium sp. 70RC1]